MDPTATERNGTERNGTERKRSRFELLKDKFRSSKRGHSKQRKPSNDLKRPLEDGSGKRSSFLHKRSKSEDPSSPPRKTAVMTKSKSFEGRVDYNTSPQNRLNKSMDCPSARGSRLVLHKPPTYRAFIRPVPPPLPPKPVASLRVTFSHPDSEAHPVEMDFREAEPVCRRVETSSGNDMDTFDDVSARIQQLKSEFHQSRSNTTDARTPRSCMAGSRGVRRHTVDNILLPQSDVPDYISPRSSRNDSFCRAVHEDDVTTDQSNTDRTRASGCSIMTSSLPLPQASYASQHPSTSAINGQRAGLMTSGSTSRVRTTSLTRERSPAGVTSPRNSGVMSPIGSKGLAIVRSPNKTLDRPLGVVFLVHEGSTKRAILPNEVTTMDTVRALFVRAFPQHLSMDWLVTQDVYIMDQASGMFYQLDDLREVRDRCVIKLHESNSRPFRHSLEIQRGSLTCLQQHPSLCSSPARSPMSQPDDLRTRQWVERMETQLATLTAYVLQKPGSSEASSTTKAESSRSTPVPDVSTSLVLQNLKEKIHDLRTCQQQMRKQHLQDREQFMGDMGTRLHQLQLHISTVFGPKDQEVRFKRWKTEQQRQLYLRDSQQVSNDLSDLESAVSELTSDDLATSRAQVHTLALSLSKVSRSLVTLKQSFSHLQDNLKEVMQEEVGVVLEDERFLRQEPNELDLRLRQCEDIMSVLLSVKRRVDFQSISSEVSSPTGLNGHSDRSDPQPLESSTPRLKKIPPPPPPRVNSKVTVSEGGNT